MFIVSVMIYFLITLRRYSEVVFLLVHNSYFICYILENRFANEMAARIIKRVLEILTAHSIYKGTHLSRHINRYTHMKISNMENNK